MSSGVPTQERKKGSRPPPLPSVGWGCTYEVRKYIYSVVVGRCLQRPTYNLEDCGKCHVKYSDDRDPLRSWVRCSNCHQWFHDSCVDHKSDDIRAGPCVCP
ncbi:Putative histone-lysine N-methyltransferase 1 [Frankliniella fusca]|uniref:Histone-lysine N-methyltransferase 1 n=1 Tax=Frankliniella fusca TaxID=407009 RepID=A0AAE1HR14_9NEOP|nr:Putative histone-lysine N-methyltransferase 1 [Frankliniella fusca]